MDENTFLEYAYFPALADGATYHPCSNGSLPRKEFMHKHDYCEIALVRSGEFSVMTEDMHTTFHGPCLEIFQSDSFHAQFDNSATTYERYLLFLNHTIPPELDALVSTIHHNVVRSVTLIPLSVQHMDWLYSIVRYLEYLYHHEKIDISDDRSLIPLRCLLEEIISLCKNEQHVPLRFNETNIPYVLTYIQSHLTDKLTLDEIAEYLHCSKTKLCTDFKKYTSMSIHQYIMKARLELSLKYLKSEYALSDVALLSGFHDSSHYIHSFQKYYGLNPSQYRKQNGI